MFLEGLSKTTHFRIQLLKVVIRICLHCLFPVIVTSLLLPCCEVDDGNRLATSCYEFVVVNLLATCYVETNLLEQLVLVYRPHQLSAMFSLATLV